MNEKYASKGLRVLAFAYKDISLEDFTELKSESNNFASKVDRDILEKELTFVGLFALKNELRDKVKESILLANKGGINVRLVSGDNLETVKAIAIQAGIVSEEDSHRSNVCMTGEEFRGICGNVVYSDETDKDGNIIG